MTYATTITSLRWNPVRAEWQYYASSAAWAPISPEMEWGEFDEMDVRADAQDAFGLPVIVLDFWETATDPEDAVYVEEG